MFFCEKLKQRWRKWRCCISLSLKVLAIQAIQTLRTAQDRIVDWWQSAYLSDGMPVGKVRFYNEAQSALPLLDQLTQPEDVIDAMQLHRERLKQDQQLSDWVR